ncbi:MAG: nucleolar 14 family protein, partial [Thaumarchaeota archaeon]|nr:nucleolar 14 family protein [Nitrososphaerota archaeon]
DFIIEDDLIASGSDLEPDETDEDSSAAEESEDESEDEFTKGLLTEGETKDPLFSLDLSARSQAGAGAGDDDGDGVPYTFPCPQTHQGLLDITETLPIAKFPVVVQRIRTLYHPRLDSKNKERLATFSRVLVQHVAHLGSSIETDVSPVLESVIRHVHSLAKSYPIDIANEFRAHIEDMEKTRPLSLNNSDLAILTAVGTIFPTSDHFHQVVTPAMLSMGRYMGQKIPQQLCDYAVGTYLSILTLQYQQLAKRYVPELMNFCLNALCALGPARSGEKLLLGFFPLHEPPRGIRVKSAKKASVRRLERKDCQPGDLDDAQEEAASLKKIAIMNTVVSVLSVAAETWSGKPAFFETFEPAVRVLKHL